MHSRDPVVASLHRLMAFAQYISVRRMIEGITATPNQTFWIMTLNLLLDAAAIEWCKVFGSWDEDTHWTRIIPKERHNLVRSSLLKAIGLSANEWKAYRHDVVSFRDQMVAHHDLDASVAKYPHFDYAFAAADFIFHEIRNVANPEGLGGIPSSLSQWSESVSRNMSAIVRVAFGASSQLGSNVSA